MSPADYRRRSERLANLRELEKLHVEWLDRYTEQARQERIELEAVREQLVELGATVEYPSV